MRNIKFRVVEKFVSVNGEGLRSGEPTVFIRFFGCNLRCSYCDTQYSYGDSPWHWETLQEIVEYVKSTGIKNVTLTGGEPLFRDGMGELVEALSGCHVEIETNGSRLIHDMTKLINRPSITLDYKTLSSGMRDKNLKTNYRFLTKRDCIKFVCGSEEDMEDALVVIKEHDLLRKTNVLFSPIFGAIEPIKIAKFIIRHKLNGARVQLQIHKIIWNPEERGV